MAKKPNMETLKEFVRKEAARFLRDPNINSVGIGYKIKGGRKTGELAVQFTVDRKAALENLEALDTTPIPMVFNVGGVLVPTDVIERKFRPSFRTVSQTTKSLRRSRCRVLVPGISVSHPKGTAGTLGAIVYDLHDGSPCMLSNWHVLHGPEGKLGDPVVQPGPYDDNRVDQNKAGTLVRSHLGVAGDCAIARIEGRGIDPVIYELHIRPARLAKPELGDRVVKSGRTTAVTHGIVSRVEITTKMKYGGNIGEIRIGCFEIAPDPRKRATGNEIGMGGDSGSVWLAKDSKGKTTDIMVGLHFAGDGQDNPDEYALACYAHSVFTKLEVAFAPPALPQAAIEARLIAGYDPNFLDSVVDLPKLSPARRADAVRASPNFVFDYTHFSLVMSKRRRLAVYVAYNVDGDRVRKLGRKGISWHYDDRIDHEYQIGDDLYAASKIDRGHLAKREDLVWGTPDEARKANEDSFHWTNGSPQHEDFNEGIWKNLEDAIFQDVKVEKLRVSVFVGPVFRENDLVYRDVRIPRDFWKVIAYVDSEVGKLQAKSFILTQDDLLTDLEALGLERFRVYQVPITRIEARTGLDFGALRKADTRLHVPEVLAGKATGISLIERLEDIR